MVKIVHVLTDTNIGGAGVWLLNYLKSYDRNKYNVCVALPENSMLKQKVSDLGIRVYEVSGIADKSFSKEGIKEFKKLFEKLKPDIVHSHASLSARIAAKKLKIKIVNTRHCLEEKKKFPVSMIYSMINNYLSDIVIGVSKAACENLIADGTDKNKVRLVYNGAFPPQKLSDEEKNKIREKYNIPRNDVIVGIVARLEPVKNHELFLKAMKIVIESCDNVTALIVGSGSMEKRLKELSKEFNIDKCVIFTGYQSDITDVMNIIDINVLTSEKEALSLSLIEGMFLEKAAVTTDSKGPCEVVENGETGIVVKNHNEILFAEAVIKLVENEQLCADMGKSGAERAEKLFSVNKMIASLDGVYGELIKDERI